MNHNHETPSRNGDLQGSVAASAANGTPNLAYENGRRDALAGLEARPGCPVNRRGRAYMSGYIAGAAEACGR